MSGFFSLLAVTSVVSLLIVFLCVPVDAGLGHGVPPANQDGETAAGAPSLAGEKKPWPRPFTALLRTRTMSVGAMLGPYSEKR